ncbi:glutamate receptor ionotropic, delta-1-like [Argiope bruennichi]|uniref:Glutamate receptor ionotropic like protein n=1 Tax=Argiope bruennichi TaxID=94029 RepID=A0A8T0EUK1_ARGBR|nr:glutamate receptor ionotropic, delta-1-like [Argiope bruennichi]KAF8778046.1 Glutamate receptor ionotropic like protein [Argiope bruennichi]
MNQRPKTTVAVLDLPYVMSVNISENGAVNVGEFEGHFLKVVLEALDVDYEIIPEKDKAYGKLLRNGTWTGMMGMMQRGEADLAFTHITMTEERTNVVNFSVPYSMTACVFVSVMPEKIKSTFGFLHPFDLNTWIAILLTFTIMIILFGLFQNKYSLFKIFFRLFANFSKQNSMPVDDSMKYKILLVTWLLFVTVVTFSWSATLLSFLIEPIRDTMVRTFRELSKAVQKGTYKATFYNMSVPFLLNSEDEDLKILGDIVVRNEWFVHVSKRGTGAYIKYRAVEAMHRNAAKMLFGNHEDLFIAEDTLYVSPMAFAYGEKFCCPSKLNSIILRLSDAGLFDKFLQDYSFKLFLKTSNKSKTENIDFALSITDLLGVFMLLGVGMLLSFVAFIGEVLYGVMHAFQK